MGYVVVVCILEKGDLKHLFPKINAVTTLNYNNNTCAIMNVYIYIFT